MFRLSFNVSTISEIWILAFSLVFVYPLGFALRATTRQDDTTKSGKPIMPHLLCYQGLAVPPWAGRLRP
jgi:hypothetical protein